MCAGNNALTLSLDKEFRKIYAQTCSCYSSFKVYQYIDKIIRNIYKSSFIFVIRFPFHFQNKYWAQSNIPFEYNHLNLATE